MREEFGKGNDFCQKITYRTGAVPVKVKVKAADGSETEETVWKSSGGFLTPLQWLINFPLEAHHPPVGGGRMCFQLPGRSTAS